MPNWTGNIYLDSLLLGSKNADTTIDYFLDPSGGAWSTTEAAAFKGAAESWSAVTNVTFVQVGSAAAADWVETKTTQAAIMGSLATHSIPSDFGSSPVITAVASVPGDPLLGNYATDGLGWDDGGLNKGGEGYATLVHEIGHGLGLDHTHADGASDPHRFPGVGVGASGENNPGDNGLNDLLYAIMSYQNGPLVRDATGVANGDNFGMPSGPMAFDIAAIQVLYGTKAAATGDDVYVLPSADAAGTFWTTIWDTGGTDQIRTSGADDANIDLRAATLQNEVGGGGFASQHKDIFGGYTIANTVVIENALSNEGNDTITGNSVGNSIDSWSGNDTVNAGQGNDTVIGGDGNDSLMGENENDSIIGSNGNDTMSGGRGDDTMDGQDDNDVINGDIGLDSISGGFGNDSIDGGQDSDTLDGHGNDDTLLGGQGYDSMLGGDGNDLMSGGTENDTLRGGNGNDTVNGDAGDDLLFGDDGNDIVNGGDGNDILEGVKGADTLDGGDGNDVVSGGEDNDQLSGGSGNDTLWGFTGNDTMDGGSGNDIFNPEGGSDVLIFADNNGNDTVNGFASTDDAEDINLAAVTAITDFADLQMNHMSQVGADVVIDTGGGNSITLIGITLGDLQTEDFIF